MLLVRCADGLGGKESHGQDVKVSIPTIRTAQPIFTPNSFDDGNAPGASVVPS
jgi:hypothetical protein